MDQLHPVLMLQGYPWKRAFFHDWENLGDKGVRGRRIQLHLECLAVDLCFQLTF